MGSRSTRAPRVITAPFLFEELWELCGRRLEDDVDLRPVHPFYRIRFDDGDVFDYSGDPELMRQEIRRFSPEDEAGYERFVTMSERIFDTGFRTVGGTFPSTLCGAWRASLPT